MSKKKDNVKKDKLVEALVNAFGAAAVRVNTEHHVQVASTPAGWHDIWISSKNGLKFSLQGKRSIKTDITVNDIISRIDGFNSTKTDLAAMHEALRIGESIQHAQSVIHDRKLDRAVFVDAGFKDGKAKAAAIFITLDGDVDVRVRNIQIESSSNAEVRAVLLGMDLRNELCDDTSVPIFTDCQAIFGHKDTKDVENVHWIPRIRNKGADRLSNMRKKKKGAAV